MVSGLRWWCRRFFCFGGTGASQLPGCEGGWRRVSFGVVFCGEWRRVSFRGCEGGRGASQLWSLVVVSSVFLFRGHGGQSASGAVKGGWRRVSFGVGCETDRRRRRRLFLFWAGGGPVSFGVGCETVRRRRRRRLFLFWGGRGPSSPSSSRCLFLFWGGRGASQLPGL